MRIHVPRAGATRRQMFVNHRLAKIAAEKELQEAQARIDVQQQLSAAQAQAAQRAIVVVREKAANEAKSEFMSLMCHEVRTPLNGCLASAEMLLEMPLQVSLFSALPCWSPAHGVLHHIMWRRHASLLASCRSIQHLMQLCCSVIFTLCSVLCDGVPSFMVACVFFICSCLVMSFLCARGDSNSNNRLLACHVTKAFNGNGFIF